MIFSIGILLQKKMFKINLRLKNNLRLLLPKKNQEFNSNFLFQLLGKNKLVSYSKKKFKFSMKINFILKQNLINKKLDLKEVLYTRKILKFQTDHIIRYNRIYIKEIKVFHKFLRDQILDKNNKFFKDIQMIQNN